VFPQSLVDPATEAFNRAHYGDIPASEEELARLRESFRVMSRTEAAEARTEISAIAEATASQTTAQATAATDAGGRSGLYTESRWANFRNSLSTCGVIAAFGLLAVVGATLLVIVLFLLPN